MVLLLVFMQLTRDLFAIAKFLFINKSDLTMYYKIYSNISAFPSNYLPRNNSVRTSHTKCDYLTQPFCRTQLFANDFFSRCVRCFNCLPQAAVAAETVTEFKRKLSNVDLSSFLRYNFNT